MKHKLPILLVICMLLQLSGVQAAEKEERLLLMSDDLAWLIDVRIKEDDSLQIGFLPANLLVRHACLCTRLCCTTVPCKNGDKSGMYHRECR